MSRGAARHPPPLAAEGRDAGNDHAVPAAPGRTPPAPRAPALWAGLRIGLLGGSFNPAHEGHRFISRQALARLKLDQVWWLVSPQNPLKPVAGMAPLPQRVSEARRAAQDPRIVVTDIERLLGTRYTADSLAALTRRFPRTRFVWLMGADNLLQISRWKRWRDIFRTLPVAVFARPPYLFSMLNGMAVQRYRKFRISEARAARLPAMEPPAWVAVRNPPHPASATAIRARRKGSAAGPTEGTRP